MCVEPFGFLSAEYELIKMSYYVNRFISLRWYHITILS